MVVECLDNGGVHVFSSATMVLSASARSKIPMEWKMHALRHRSVVRCSRVTVERCIIGRVKDWLLRVHVLVALESR